MIERRRSQPSRSGRVRMARLTDLAAVGELSRLSHADEPDRNAHMRTLGLPVTRSNISVFSLFRLPLGAFRPTDLLYVYEERGRLAGLARVERDGLRDEWTIVELDAIDNGEAGDVRFRLVQHLLRDAAKRGALRFHVACADAQGNVDLFMQAGFARYGEEHILYRQPDAPAIKPIAAKAAARDGIREAAPLDALDLDRLYRAVTPAPVARLEDYRLHDWERQGSHWRIPRSSLTPILRFADVEAFIQMSSPDDSKGGVDAFCQLGFAKEDQPHYLRVLSRPDQDATPLIEYGLGLIAERRGDHGVVSAVRTYEAPLDRRLEEFGFERLASVSLLMKETAIRVFEPALVVATTR